MIWPWSKIKRLEDLIKWYEGRDNDRLFHIELYKNIALQKMRDLAAANKGIRRLKAKLKKASHDKT